MTRAQAIRTIIRCLDGIDGLDDNLRQAIQVLKDMLSEYPGKMWDDRSIRTAVEQFISIHNRPPTVKELDTLPGLPCHGSIELEFGMKAGKWLIRNYPSRKQLWYRFRDEEHTPDEYRAVFIREYNRIHPRSSLAYNRERNPFYPSWEYTAKKLGLRRWSELIDACREELEPRPSERRRFRVESTILRLDDLAPAPGKPES